LIHGDRVKAPAAHHVVHGLAGRKHLLALAKG
jgi:hypothetical protein